MSEGTRAFYVYATERIEIDDDPHLEGEALSAALLENLLDWIETAGPTELRYETEAEADAREAAEAKAHAALVEACEAALEVLGPMDHSRDPGDDPMPVLEQLRAALALAKGEQA
jgi:hypothetical protein